jgi:hypothetical protein
MDGNIIIQSYVWHGGKCFFVSTINRRSPAAAAYGAIYAETMAWDYASGKRGALVYQPDACQDSMRGHFAMCERMRADGLATES